MSANGVVVEVIRYVSAELLLLILIYILLHSKYCNLLIMKEIFKNLKINGY